MRNPYDLGLETSCPQVHPFALDRLCRPSDGLPTPRKRQQWNVCGRRPIRRQLSSDGDTDPVQYLNVEGCGELLRKKLRTLFDPPPVHVHEIEDGSPSFHALARGLA